jgi:hypothetical protein
VRNDPDGGSAKRYDDWLVEYSAVASAAWQATAWVMRNDRFDMSMARRFGLTRPIVAWGPRDCTGCEHNKGVLGRDKYGDHDEGTCTKNGGHRTSAHDVVHDLLIAFLRQCHF